MPLTFVSFHGSGLDSGSLADFLHGLDPTALTIAFDGPIKNGSGFNFWNRRPDGSIDAAELLDRAQRFADSNAERLAQASKTPRIAIGYSSGAIFAQAIIAIAPDCFDAAILMRSAPISSDFAFPPMLEMPVLIISGRSDARRRPDDGNCIASQMENAGALVQQVTLDCGHGWAGGNADLTTARTWVKEVVPVLRTVL